MPAFQYRLKTLLRLREAARDERRSELAQALRADTVLADQLAAIHEQLAGLRRNAASGVAPGKVNVDRLLDTQRYELILRGEEHLLQVRREALAQEIERRRNTLVEADREVRVLEKVREVQFQRYCQDEERRSMTQLDELALRPYQNREQD